MIKILLLLFPITFLGCMTATSSKIHTNMDYDTYNQNIKKSIPNIRTDVMDSNQSIQISVWKGIQGAEDAKSLSVKKGDKIHLLKKTETKVLPTNFEGLLFNENDTLFCSVTSNFVDPKGHSQYILDVATGKEPIKGRKSYLLYNPIALVTSIGGFYYLSKDNPLMSADYKSKMMILHIIGDMALVLGIIGIATDNTPLTVGGFSVAGVSKVFNIFENEFINEYNGYSSNRLIKKLKD